MPSVLFVCSRNSGKSQMAAALLRSRSGGRVDVYSAATRPGPAVNEEARASLARLGVVLGNERPTLLDPELLADVDRVVVLGYEAVVAPVPGMKGTIEVWHLDEPSAHGIQGETRMDLIRDELDDRVSALLKDLGVEDLRIDEEDDEPTVVITPSSRCRSGS